MDSAELWIIDAGPPRRLTRDELEAIRLRYRAAGERYGAAFNAYYELVAAQARKIISGEAFSPDELSRTRLARAALELARSDLRDLLPRSACDLPAVRSTLPLESS
jgi:hypothetical protein